MNMWLKSATLSYMAYEHENLKPSFYCNYIAIPKLCTIWFKHIIFEPDLTYLTGLLEMCVC